MEALEEQPFPFLKILPVCLLFRIVDFIVSDPMDLGRLDLVFYKYLHQEWRSDILPHLNRSFLQMFFGVKLRWALTRNVPIKCMGVSDDPFWLDCVEYLTSEKNRSIFQIGFLHTQPEIYGDLVTRLRKSAHGMLVSVEKLDFQSTEETPFYRTGQLHPVRELIEVIQRCPKLTNLAIVGLADDSLVINLCGCTELAHVYLPSCDGRMTEWSHGVTGYGLKALANSPVGNRLLSLNISRMKELDNIALLEISACCHQLRHLDISNNNHRDLHYGFTMIASHCLHLQRLDLSFCFWLTGETFVFLRGKQLLTELEGLLLYGCANVDCNILPLFCELFPRLDLLDISHWDFGRFCGDDLDASNLLDAFLGNENSLHNPRRLFELHMTDEFFCHIEFLQMKRDFPNVNIIVGI